MESFYIVSFQSKEILLSKEYSNNNNIEIVQEFLLNSEKILNLNSYSNFILLNNNLFFIFQIIDENMDIIFIIITNEDSIYIPSYLTILDNIINSLKNAFEASIDKNLIRDNIILILLMLQHYLNYGVPIYTDSYINSSLINPYKLTDKISEKIIGLAKIYNISTIKNYLQNLQLNLKNDNKFFYIDKNKEQTPKVLFDYIDKINLICDKKGNILNNKCFTEINVNSQVQKTFEINTLINIPFEFLSFSKDKLVKNNKKEIFKKKSFDAIIKHGHYTLMNFLTVLSNNFIQLPFKLKLENKNENSKIELLIEIESNPIKEIQYEINNIKIILNFNIDYDCSIKNINLSANEGEFEINEIKKEAIWKIKNFKENKIFLKGSVLINSKNNNDINNILNNYSILMNLSCEIEKYSISGGNLTKVNINDEELKNSINKYYKNKTIIKDLEVIF